MFSGPPSPRRLLGASRAAVSGAAAAAGGVVGGVAGVASGAAGVAGGVAAAVAATGVVPALQPPAPVRAASRTVDRVRDDVGREVSSAARALVDLHPARVRRRVWASRGRAHIEVRGLDGTAGRAQQLTSEVTQRLGRLAGVRWAEVNAVTGQVLVAFDEGRVDVGTLLSTVRAVEQSQGTRDEDFPWSRPVHPADTTPVAAAAVELAADCVAATAAAVGTVFHLPTVPRGVRAAVTLMEVEKPLRRVLKRQVGPIGTDVVITLASAAVTGLTHNPVAPAIDAMYRFELLAEALSRQVAWRRREAELCALPDLLPHEVAVRRPRPRPRPKGPVETWVDQLGPGTLASAAAVLGLTRRPGRAAEAILVAAPKAAKVGRDSFAAVLATRLAGHGVLALNAAAFRRLDRVSAVVLDSSVLSTSRLQVLAAEAVRGSDDAAVWTAAVPVLRGRTMADLGTEPLVRDDVSLQREQSAQDVAAGAVRLTVRRGRRRLGFVTVARELDPHAQALVEAAVSSGARVLLTDDAAAADLRPLVDDVLDAREPLADAVRGLQEDGHLVLVVSERDDQALAAADVGIAVTGRTDGVPVCWSAHLVTGADLDGAWRVLHAIREAHHVSRRGVRLARSGSALGTLLAVVGGRGRGGSSHAQVPVHTAALAALMSSTVAALRVSGTGPPRPVRHVPWHALDPVDVLAALDGTRADADARRRASVRDALASAAGSVVMTARESPVLRRVGAPVTSVAALAAATGEELRDPLTPVLAVGAAASAIVGSGIDALLVAGVMSGNALVSGGQRVRAEGALRGMLLEQEPSARRIAQSRRGQVSATEDLAGVPHEVVRARRLQPGDVIALQASDVVPADARLLVARDLEVDESSLTGESVPVDKDVAATPAAPLAERRCMVYEGTTVLAGSAHAVVVAAGEATEAGRAARAGGRASPPAGIQARLAEVTRAAMPMTAFGGLGVTGLAVLRGVPLRDAVAAGVSIAVAAVPEGLPLVATVAQASAGRRLSRAGVLVRSSRTLEACGRVDTVCFDKTGTLTEGRLRVARLATLCQDVEDESVEAQRVLLAAARACPPTEDGGIGRLPHATDRAILEAAAEDLDGLEAWDRLSELPFETNRGYSASLGQDGGEPVLFVKGAPEVVLSLCRNRSTAAAAHRTAERLAREGLRVIAVAERRGVERQGEDLESLVEDLTLLGFVGIADQPRAVAEDAVRRLRADGVRSVMVTGDHPLTARAIARAVGIDGDGPVLTGADLERMTEVERVRRVAETSVFARVSPEQKVRIVAALQSAGRVVAMTGDGTNDAAAIRLADVGIGVASSGSTSARSAADVVLTDADVTRIHDAVVEGRALWRRVRDAVSILVGGNAGEVAFMVAGTAVAGNAPINVRQMLLVNVLTDMFPALAVAVSDSPSDDEGGSVVAALDDGLKRAVAVRGTATAIGATAAWGIGRVTGFRRRASTMGLAALVGTQLGQTLVTGRRSRLVVLTCLLSAAVLFAAVETPGVSQFLGCTPVGPGAWGVVVACSAAGTLLAVLAPRVLTRVAAATRRV